MITANVRERRETADARHVEVEEEQIRFRILLDHVLQRIETVCLDDARIRNAIADRVNQRFAKQRVVVSDDK